MTGRSIRYARARRLRAEQPAQLGGVTMTWGRVNAEAARLDADPTFPPMPPSGGFGSWWCSVAHRGSWSDPIHPGVFGRRRCRRCGRSYWY